MIWKSQFQNILRATNLIGYVDGSSPCPPALIQDSTGKESTNSEFLTCKQVDSHLLSCITATLTPAVFTSVLQCSTSCEVWTLLTKRFTSLSRSHIHQLKNKLNAVSKKSLSMEDYLLQIKIISDQLALVSSPVEEEDLILIVLNGLPVEYNSLKTAIRARPESITMSDLSSLLCLEALHVESESHPSSSLSDHCCIFCNQRSRI